METPRRGERPSPKGLLARLDRAAGTMNAFLLVLAIGLAVLDFTCFWIIKVHDAMPTATRVSAGAGAAAAATPPARRNLAKAAATQTGGAAAGF